MLLPSGFTLPSGMTSVEQAVAFFHSALYTSANYLTFVEDTDRLPVIVCQQAVVPTPKSTAAIKQRLYIQTSLPINISQILGASPDWKYVAQAIAIDQSMPAAYSTGAL